MIAPGQIGKLFIVNQKPQGVYLGETMEAGPKERVLLPAREVPEGASPGDCVEVFLYRDSDDRLIATTSRPLLLTGETALLKVKDVTKIGAFLDWGLPKDLLLPFREQTAKVMPGEEVLAALYVDKSGRLAATMKVYPFLRTDSPYIPNESVTGRVYQITPGHGAYVAVDDRYSGMIPERELPSACRVGEVLSLRVTAVKEDGKLDLSAREKAYLQMDADAETVVRLISDRYSGELPFDDKADPEMLREVFGMSKAAFKRAVGRLYKEHRVALENGHIRVLE